MVVCLEYVSTSVLGGLLGYVYMNDYCMFMYWMCVSIVY